MHIEIHDTELEARMQRQLAVSGSVEETLGRLLQTQEEQDRWLAENREEVRAQIREGIEQLDRGEGIPEEHLDEYLRKAKAEPA